VNAATGEEAEAAVPAAARNDTLETVGLVNMIPTRGEADSVRDPMVTITRIGGEMDRYQYTTRTKTPSTSKPMMPAILVLVLTTTETAIASVMPVAEAAGRGNVIVKPGILIETDRVTPVAHRRRVMNEHAGPRESARPLPINEIVEDRIAVRML